jgi:hypothetical protein
MSRLGLKWSMLVAGTVSVGQWADGKLPRMRWVRAALPALPGLIPFAAGVPLLNDGHMIGAAGASGNHYDWTLLAAHIRTAHVHVVVAAEVPPERIMNALKSYSGRALNCHRRWARHGSTLYLWTRDEVARPINYVIEKQGEPTAVYAGDLRAHRLGTTTFPLPNPDRKGGDRQATIP